MHIEDPYQELGLAPEATDAEVKAAWRKLSARWHPDRNASPQALRKIQRINRAVEEIRRAREPASPGSEAAEADEASAVLHRVLELSVEEAMAGGTRELRGELPRPCGSCQGSGTGSGPCSACAGQGTVRQPLWFGWMAAPTECAACRGTGQARDTCSDCEGSGQDSPLRFRARVRFPAGVRAGQRLAATARLQGGGDRGLEVRVALAEHPFFIVDADGSVRLTVPVDGFAWMAERWIDVPTPGGPRQMRLRRGSLVYRIRREGFPGPEGGERADCLVTVTPLFPSEPNPVQQSLLDALIAAHTGDPASEAGRRIAEWQEQVRSRNAGRT